MAIAQESEFDLDPAKNILDKITQDGSKVKGDDLIPILQEIQDAYGYLPSSVLTWVSKYTGIPTSRMYGVITFYAQFYLEPHGEHTIRCCRGTACHVKGAKRLADKIKEELDVEDGGTTEDMRYTYEEVACLGTCFLAPVIMIDDDYYGQLVPDKISKIQKEYS